MTRMTCLALSAVFSRHTAMSHTDSLLAFGLSTVVEFLCQVKHELDLEYK